MKNMETEVKTKDLELVTRLLTDVSVVNWVKREGVSISTSDLTKMGVKSESIALMSKDAVSMLVVDGTYTKKAHTIIGLEQLKELINRLPKEALEGGKLIVCEESNQPVALIIPNNVIIVAPRTEE